jgi:ATP-dependent DNA ligase
MSYLDCRAALKTRKGLDWTAKFQTIADAIIDGEIVTLDETAHQTSRPCRRPWA